MCEALHDHHTSISIGEGLIFNLRFAKKKVMVNGKEERDIHKQSPAQRVNSLCTL